VSIAADERSELTEIAHSQQASQKYQRPAGGQFAWRQPFQSRGRRSVPRATVFVL